MVFLILPLIINLKIQYLCFHPYLEAPNRADLHRVSWHRGLQPRWRGGESGLVSRLWPKCSSFLQSLYSRAGHILHNTWVDVWWVQALYCLWSESQWKWQEWRSSCLWVLWPRCPLHLPSTQTREEAQGKFGKMSNIFWYQIIFLCGRCGTVMTAEWPGACSRLVTSTSSELMYQMLSRILQQSKIIFFYMLYWRTVCQ